MENEMEKFTNEEYLNTKENRTYKDSVMVDLFCEDVTAKENQLSLFNALHDTHYTLDEIEITDIRIPNAIYMNFRSDMATNITDYVLILSEHQSTINNNMPLRKLMHIGRTYEMLIPVKDRYKKKMVKIPRPEFYVFYNGREKIPDEMTLRLSDAYKDSNDLTENGSENLANVLDNRNGTSLELVVKVFNINPDSGSDILKKCPVLMEYSLFVSCVRRHKEQGEDDAMKKAIEECIEKNILRDYLLRRSSEVVNMLCAEYDYDMDIAVQREESYEDGFEDGKKSNQEDVALKLLKSRVDKDIIISSTDISEERLKELQTKI